MKGFKVVPASPPQVQQGPRLLSADAIGTAEQGVGVAISADGRTVIVGGPGDNNNIGAAWIWVCVGSQWIPLGGKLVGSGYTGQSRQGSRVALNARGDLAVVAGANSASQNFIWTFVREDTGSWKEWGSPTAIDGYYSDIAISADGKTLVSTVRAMGAVVFRREVDSWEVQSSLYTGTDSGDLSVAMSANGSTILIGNPWFGDGVGSVSVFTRNIGGSWSSDGILIGSETSGQSNQGMAVALSADGETAIVGGYNDDGGRGAAWVFTKEVDGWRQQGDKLMAPSSAVSKNGISVSLSADGSTAAVGAATLRGLNYESCAFIWRRKDARWFCSETPLIGRGATTPGSGPRLAIDANGSTAIFGDPSADPQVGESNVGAAYIFRPHPPEIDDFAPVVGAIGTLVSIKGRHLSDVLSVTIGGVEAWPISNDDDTLVVMVMPGAASGPLTVTTGGGTAMA